MPPAARHSSSLSSVASARTSSPAKASPEPPANPTPTVRRRHGSAGEELVEALVALVDAVLHAAARAAPCAGRRYDRVAIAVPIEPSTAPGYRLRSLWCAPVQPVRATLETL